MHLLIEPIQRNICYISLFLKLIFYFYDILVILKTIINLEER